MRNFRFQKEERLTRKKTIEDLFQRGTSFSAFPLKVIFTLNQEAKASRNRVLISVPTRIFKKATQRNTLKRRIREGYRLNKGLLVIPTTFSLAYIYIAKEILPSTTIHQAVQSSLRRLNRYENKN
jgi:ribonuclease P protein component